MIGYEAELCSLPDVCNLTKMFPVPVQRVKIREEELFLASRTDRDGEYDYQL